MIKYLICIFGKSGSGKDTIIRKLLEKCDFLTKCIPYTSRPMRSGEIDGEEYNFLSKEEFESYVDNDKFMEHRKYSVFLQDGTPDIWYYGNMLPKEKYSIMIPTPEVYETIKTAIPSDYIIIPIYIDINKEERLLRVILRELNSEKQNFKEMIRRFFADENDFKEDYMILNGTILEDRSNVFINNDIEEVSDNISSYIIKIISKKEGNKK